MQTPIITLTTDFGDVDGYVAQMKGILLGRLPSARLIDVTHRVPPQDVLRGALILDEIVDAFPAGTFHLAVIDPGVGTSRPIVAMEAAGQCFVAPDNGLLSLVAGRHPPERIVACTNPAYWRETPSQTFHGRDIMAPLVAHWAGGTDPSAFGPSLDALAVRLLDSSPEFFDGHLRGRVLWADHFGNLVTNIRTSHLPAADYVVTVGLDRGAPVVTAYEDVPAGEVLAVVGSSGRLEISVNGGSAAAEFGWTADPHADPLPVHVGWRTA